MATINHMIEIEAPVDKVFSVVTAPENWTRYVTSLVDVSNTSADCPAKNSTFDWTYKMMGFKFSGKGTVTDNTPGTSFGLKLEGKTLISESYSFTDKGGGKTELKIKIDYEMPGEVLKALTDNSLVEKLNMLEANAVLKKVKALCEV